MSQVLLSWTPLTEFEFNTEVTYLWYANFGRIYQNKQNLQMPANKLLKVYQKNS